MDQESFVENVIGNSSAGAFIGMLREPPGRKPDEWLTRLSSWFNALGTEDQAIVRDLIVRVEFFSVRTILGMLDGTTAVAGELGESRRLVLDYESDSVDRVTINEVAGDLDDIYSVRVGFWDNALKDPPV